MKFTVADILDQLHSSGIISIVELEQRLGLFTKIEKQQLSITISALTQIGILRETDEGIERVSNDHIVEAQLRCSSKCFCFALRDDGEEDIYIRDYQVNHAWNGDRVFVKIIRDGGRKRSPEGEIICILERQSTSFIGQLERRKDKLVAIPLDDRILSVIDLIEEPKFDLDLSQQIIAEIKIDRYALAQLPAQGHVVRVLNIKGNVASDRELLIAKYALPHHQPLPHFVLNTPISKHRYDLTEQTVILWKGFDSVDNLSLPGITIQSTAPFSGGTSIRLWIHAPLIAERVELNTTLDLLLRKRANALFVMGEFVPLLTRNLAEDSEFKVGKTQSAISVALDLSTEGELIHYRFFNSLIRPTIELNSRILSAFRYRKPETQSFSHPFTVAKDYLNEIDQLFALASQLRRRRLAIGSVDLDFPDLPINALGDQCLSKPTEAHNGWMISTSCIQPFGLLREFLQVAHSALGHYLSTLGLPCIYSANEAADPAAINEVAKTAAGINVTCRLNEDGNVSSLQEMVIDFAATDRVRVLNQQLKAIIPGITLSSQPKPNIVSGGYMAYANWTCGSLHYADIFNQYILSWLLGKTHPKLYGSDNSLAIADGNKYRELLKTIVNESDLLSTFYDLINANLVNCLESRSLFAADLLADGVALAQARAAESLLGHVLTGVITCVQSYGFFVEIPPFNLEGLVHVSSFKDDWYEYHPKQNRLVGRKHHRAYILSHKVNVRIQTIEAIHDQIDLVVVNPDSSLRLYDKGESLP
uniref:Putative acetazolamide conferring resistance protein Zam n=1 Tax=Paulinella micropora TaxID=1928728 RepID=A0A385I1K6_9EUKA|nr:putative acetazolamide conferring resistance protein Zam [Paulinella micropora]AXY63754.1 putative acetazolamide conferring resistance protein Zam [Paulinella micropora]